MQAVKMSSSLRAGSASASAAARWGVNGRTMTVKAKVLAAEPPAELR